MSSEQAQETLAEYRTIDVGWDAYLIEEDGQRDPPGIYLFVSGGIAYCAFEIL